MPPMGVDAALFSAVAVYASAGPWSAADIAFRAGLLMVMLVPMAVSDIRSRTVDSALLYGMCGMGAVMFAHDFLAGRYHSAGPLVLAGATVSLAIGGLMLAAARIAGIMGDADGAAVLAAAAAMPAVGDLPVVPAAVAVSCALGAVLTIGGPLCTTWRTSCAGGRRRATFCTGTSSGPGSGFCVAEAMLDASGTGRRIAGVDDEGTVRNADAKSTLCRLRRTACPWPTRPPCTPAVLGIAAVCAALLSSNFDASHVQRLAEEGLWPFLADPGCRFGIRHG